jgi:hypothetical protein
LVWATGRLRQEGGGAGRHSASMPGKSTDAVATAGKLQGSSPAQYLSHKMIKMAFLYKSEKYFML